MSQLGHLIRRSRTASGLSRTELVELLGYRNVNRGHRRLMALEKDGQAQHDLLNKVVAILNIDEDAIREAVAADREKMEAAWESWASEPVPMKLLVKYFSGFYAPVPLPTEVSGDRSLAEEYARQVAKSMALKACLVLSRRESIWIDEDGSFNRQEVSTGEISGPFMKMKGCHFTL